MSFLRNCIRSIAESSDDSMPPIDPATLSDVDFDEAIDLLFEPKLLFAAEDLLRRAGPRSEAAMLRAMRHGKLFSKSGAATGVYRSPLHIVGNALLRLGSRDWADSIRPHVLSEDRCLSSACLYFLGHLAGRGEIDLIRQILAAPEENFDSPGETLARALLQRLKRTPRDRTELLPLFNDLWNFCMRGRSDATPAARLLVHLNRDGAIQRVRNGLLAQPEKVDRRMLIDWLQALASAHVKLGVSEVERLFLWAGDLNDPERKYQVDRLRGAVLLLGALARSPLARTSIDARLADEKEDRISQYALRAHALWHDIDFWAPPVDWMSKDLPEPVQHYRLYTSLSGQISNGGICQYFSNSTGDDARFALDALAAIGDEVARSILLDAMRAFGRAGPSPDRTERNRQLDALLPREESRDAETMDPFAGIDDRWFKHSNKGCGLLLEYMIRHATYFQFKD